MRLDKSSQLFFGCKIDSFLGPGECLIHLGYVNNINIISIQTRKHFGLF